jgi:dTDP-glucose 4,6-dehydratase
MRVLVTGGAGFIGSHFVRKCLSSAYKEIDSVLVLDKLTYAGNLSNLPSFEKGEIYKFIKGDICDSNLVQSLMLDIDGVVNFAAESHVDRSIGNAAEFVETNVSGVQVLLDAIKASERTIRFVQVSTDEVYGSIDSGSWDENEPLLPNSPYAASKASSDLVARSYFRTHGLNLSITRCSNNFGKYQYPEKVIPLFITNLITGKKVPLYGDGLNIRDWLHVDDHCRGIDLVVNGGRAGEIYNIGGGTEMNNKDLTFLLLEKCGFGEERVEWVEDRLGHDRRYSVNWNKINNELGYSPQESIQTSIGDIVAWYKANPQWWEPLRNITK